MSQEYRKNGAFYNHPKLTSLILESLRAARKHSEHDFVRLGLIDPLLDVLFEMDDESIATVRELVVPHRLKVNWTKFEESLNQFCRESVFTIDGWFKNRTYWVKDMFLMHAIGLHQDWFKNGFRVVNIHLTPLPSDGNPITQETFDQVPRVLSEIFVASYALSQSIFALSKFEHPHKLFEKVVNQLEVIRKAENWLMDIITDPASESFEYDIPEQVDPGWFWEWYTPVVL